MKKTALLMVAIALSAASEGFTEPIRPLLCKENRTPGLHKFEVGSQFTYKKIDEPGNLARNEGDIAPYFRFGILKNLTAYSKIPFGFIDSDIKGKHNGIKDISAGFELMAMEQTFTCPDIIPYVEITFPTGDEDKDLGQDDYSGRFGTAIATTVNDIYHFILDGQYNYSEHSTDKSEGLFSIATAIIWNISDQFAVLGEAKISQKPSGNDDIPAYFNGGMCYEATKNLSIYWYGGTTVNTDEKGSANVKIAYSF